MSGAGRADFFSREAGDYLRQLEPLLEAGTPQLDALVRLARGLRGAAMLAGPAAFARAAEELERLIRGLREGALQWTDLAPRLRSILGDLRRLASVAPFWNEASDREAKTLAAGLRDLAGNVPTPITPVAPGAAAARGYIARETAVVAGALERAVPSGLGSTRVDQAGLMDVRRTMQPLRGLAALADFPPLAELLDAIDAAMLDLARSPAPSAEVARFCHHSAAALGRIARAVAAGDPVPPDLPEASQVADLLFSLLAGPETAAPVAELLIPDDAVAPFGGRRDQAPTADPVDLAGLGDTLRQAAASLRTTASGTARRLRTFALVGDLRTLRGALGHRPAGPFLARLLSSLENDPDFREADRLPLILDRAGRLLSDDPRAPVAEVEIALDVIGSDIPAVPATPDPVVALSSLLLGEERTEPTPPRPADRAPTEPAPSPRLMDRTASPVRTAVERSLTTYRRRVIAGTAPPPFAALFRPGTETAPVPSPAGVVLDEAVVSIEELLEAQPEPAVVPIEDLLAPDAAPVVSIDRLRHDREETGPVPLENLLEDRGVVPIEALLEGGTVPVMPIHALFYEEPAIVPIDQLLYRGRRALERADQIRHALSQALSVPSGDFQRLEPLLRELLDLVPLALAEPA